MKGHKRFGVFASGGIAALIVGTVGASGSTTAPGQDTGAITPIQHLVVIFQENVSFDHYFATYPHAANPAGEPAFYADRDTPSVNGLNDSLMGTNNPNSVPPFRLDRSQYETTDQDHNYTDEQRAYDHGLMDRFVEEVGRGRPDESPSGVSGGLVMGYYDGNTVTGLWNYAQTYAMSDNSFSTTFGPSTPGALNLVSGQTHGATPPELGFGTPFVDTAMGTVIGDPQPAGDTCDSRADQVTMSGQNIGNLLNAHGVSWGWFQGGFRDCAQSHANKAGIVSKDYIPHHEPFQYYPSTANPAHTPPATPAEIGHSGAANHQYDLVDFYTALDSHNLPAVSFLKAPAYQDGHARYSDPLDEQEFLVTTINRLENTPYWNNLAVVILYDDSDGWYDHQMGPVVNQSQDSRYDALRGTDCGARADANHTLGTYQDRCGYGPRQPLLIVSPFAKTNFVDHSVTDQTSVLRFIEDNWQTGRIGNFSLDVKAGSIENMLTFAPHGPVGGANKLFLDPQTGTKQK